MADATLRITADTRDAERALGRLQGTLSRLGSTVLLGGAVKSLIDVADSATNLQNKLQQVSSSQDYVNYTFDKLAGIANAARAPLDAVGSLYFSMARSARTLGISNEEARLATELLAKGMTSSGMSAQEASGPLLQLSQALQSGTFQGDELRSVLEGMPTVSKALADSLGVPITALKVLGEQGKISGQALIQAILKAKTVIETDFAKTVPTIGQALTVLSNNFTVFIDKLNKSSGATNGISKAIGYVADAINFLGDNIETVMTIFQFLMLIPLVRGISLIGRLFYSLSRSITSVGYMFNGLAGSVGNFVKYFLSGWRSLITQVTGAKTAFSGIGDMFARAIFLPISFIFKQIGNLFRNFAGPLAVIGAYLLGIFDPVLEWFKDMGNEVGKIINKVTSFMGFGNVFGETPAKKAVDNTQSDQQKKLNLLLEDQKKVQAEIGAQQFKYNEDLKKSLATQALANEFDRQKGVIADDILAYNRAIAEETLKAQQAGAKISPELARQVGELAKQKVIIEQITAGVEKYRTLTVAGLDQSAQVEYFQNIKNLTEAFNAGRIATETEFQQALLQLTQEFEMQKYEAAIALEDKKWAYKEMLYARQLQAEKNLLGMNVFSAEQSKQIAADKTAFEKKSELEKTQFAIDQAGQMFTALGQYNRKAFAAAKAFNIANAIMNTYMAATKALATYPPPFSFIAAGAAIAMGLAQVATIASQNYSGRAIGGPVMGNKPYIVGERGPELMVPQGAGKVVPNASLGGQPVNVNFTINAVDSRGVDQLLMERKGMIVGMIRSAINDRGARAPL